MTQPQHRAERTRAAVVTSAAREIDRHGFVGTSITAILASSGVTKGAFYFHFRSKDDLAVVIVEAMSAVFSPILLDWARRDMDALQVMLGVADEVTARLMFDPVIRAGVRICAEGVPGVMDTATPLHDWSRILTHLLVRAEREGVLRRGVEPSLAAEVVLSVVLGVRFVAEQLTESEDLWQRIRAGWVLLLPSLATDEWLAAWRRSGWLTAPPPVPPDPSARVVTTR